MSAELVIFIWNDKLIADLKIEGVFVSARNQLVDESLDFYGFEGEIMDRDAHNELVLALISNEINRVLIMN